MYDRIGANIKRAREEMRLSQAELGSMLGVTATAVNYYEKGKRKIDIDDLYRLSIITEKPLEYFLEDGRGKHKGDAKHLSKEKTGKILDLIDIPVVGVIRAGEPLLSDQSLSGYLPFPREMADMATFALWVTGDSMVEEGIEEGDLVFIRRQDHVEYNGQIVCALINGEESALKIFFKEGEGRIRLRSANSNYPDIVLENHDEIEIQGVYAGVYKLPKELKAGQYPEKG
ncbi:MAG: helix-turn-helix domain-containing protein [Firmicutes bacterium]|nr:helix-turn-helix domain-containing protein [Bacillota bacterium]